MRVFVDLEFRAHLVDDFHADVAVVKIAGTFLVTYLIKSEATFPDDALQHFAELNGAYNAWPYWRELVQAFAGRAGLSGVVVPVFRPKRREIPTEEAHPLPDQSETGTPSLP